MRNLDKKIQHSIIFVALFGATIIGYLFTNSTFFASTIWVALGFALGFYTAFGKKYLLTIFLGILVGNVFSRIFFTNEEIYVSFIFSVITSGINILQIVVFRYIYPRIKFGKLFNIKEMVAYFLSMLFVAFLGAFIAVTIFDLLNETTDYLQTLLQWGIGDLLGMIIFTTAIIFSVQYDKEITRKKMIQGLIFIILFGVIGFALLSGLYPLFNYLDFAYIFMILFFISAFIFNYRMIIVISLIFLLLSQHAEVEPFASGELGLHAFALNFYLLVLAHIAMFTRLFLYTNEEKNNELQASNIQLEKLIDSTNRLFEINETRDYTVDSNINYLKNIFQIALSLYDNFDYASCYIKINNSPHFIDSLGYDVDNLNKMDFTEGFDWAMGKPNHVIVNEAKLFRKIPKELQKGKDRIPSLKESIRFGIMVDNKFSGGMSFDIEKGNEATFAKTDYDTFQSFHKLMNSFYEINYLTNKKNSFKNDMVLSLISTLELYDQYTSGHSEQVAHLALKVGSKLGLKDAQKNELYWAAVVHDIGKVGIDSKVINKTTKLTAEEYELVKKHSENGAIILSKSEDLKEIAKIVLHHHEWWDGTGYPDGLKGNDIPLSSQILTVADAVSAMSGTRPYSITKTTEEIINELAKFSGIMFSPKIAVIMIECLNEGILAK